MATRVRYAAVGDAPTVGEILVSAWRQAYRGLIPAWSFAEVIAKRRQHCWRRWLSPANPGTLIVFEDGRTLLGYCLSAPPEDADAGGEPAGEIVSLNVRPECWRRGVGRALCDQALDDAARRGWVRLVAWSIEYDAAGAFCGALGFTLDGARRADSTLTGGPFSEIRYQKVL